MARRLAPAIIITLVLLLIGAAQHALGASGDPAAELALGALPPACIPYWPVEAAEKQEQHLKLLQVGWRGFCPQ